jgi:predicted nucleic acid-binding protein
VAELVALDTNVYIRALRDSRLLEQLKLFLRRAGARVRLPAIVAMELRAGAWREAQTRAVEQLVRPFAERELVITASFEAYMQAGRVLAALAEREHRRMSDAAPSFVSDVVLACACREAGATLVTENVADFAGIQRHLRGFRFEDAAVLAS